MEILNRKKILFNFVIFWVAAFLTFGVMEAGALSTVSLTPVRVSVVEGQQFTLSLAINPDVDKNYTAKIELQFPPLFLEVRSFLFDSSLIPLIQPGYDVINNKDGLVIKTGGYPGGVSSRARFGVATFVAKKTGVATIMVGGNSFILDERNKNVINTQPVETIVTISEATVVKEFDIPDDIPSDIPDEILDDIPSEIPDGYIFASDLEVGDRSVDVAYVQICLLTEGIYKTDVSGYFGLITKKAVVEFQEKYSEDILIPFGFTIGTGVVDQMTQAKLNELCTRTVLPEQLFDINLDLIDRTITNTSELIAKVSFLSFGTIPTLVDLTFIIEDEDKNEIYRKKSDITVETEELFTQTFEGIELSVGKYSVVLITLYNTDVYDEFRQDFEIVAEEPVRVIWKIWVPWLVFVLLLLSSLLFIFYKRRKKKEDVSIRR